MFKYLVQEGEQNIQHIMIKIAVIDDEKAEQDYLESLVHQRNDDFSALPFIQVKTYSSGEAFLFDDNQVNL